MRGAGYRGCHAQRPRPAARYHLHGNPAGATSLLCIVYRECLLHTGAVSVSAVPEGHVGADEQETRGGPVSVERASRVRSEDAPQLGATHLYRCYTTRPPPSHTRSQRSGATDRTFLLIGKGGGLSRGCCSTPPTVRPYPHRGLRGFTYEPALLGHGPAAHTSVSS